MKDHNEDVAQYRAGQVIRIGKASITATETAELRRLLEVIAQTCDAAGSVVRAAGPPPVGQELERLREMNDRVGAMVERVNSILGDSSRFSP